FGVINPDGSVWCSSAPLPIRVKLADRGYVRTALKSSKPTLGEYQIGRVTGLPSIVFASPIVEHRRVTGVAFASLRASAFGVLGHAVAVPEGATYLIIDHEGRVLQRYPEALEWQGRDLARTSLFRAALESNQGSLQTADVDGVSRLYGFAWTGPDIAQSVLVAVGVPHGVAVSPANRYLLFSLLVLLVVTALTIGLTSVASRVFILWPVKRLLQATRRIASGELAFRARIDQASELGELGRAVDEMAASLEQQQQTLRTNEARFRDLTELSSDWYW